jgi:hypothetical protein
MKGDCRGRGLDNRREDLVIERAAGVVDREGAVRQLTQASPLQPQLCGAADRGANAAEPAGVAYGGGELDLLPGTERSQDDR